jgi:diaminopimelate epimerase
VRVQARGGVLTVAWNGEQLRMTGPAESVFTGQVDIDKLVFSMGLNR